MKRVVRLTAIMAVMMMGILISSNASLAKDGITTLKKNKVYKAYDVTGDGKADKIKVISKTKKKNDMNTMKIMINGKQAFKHKEYCGTPYVSIIQLEDGQNMISVFHSGLNDYGVRTINTYVDSKWKKIMNLNSTKIEDKYDGPAGSPIAVSGNAVTIQFGCQSAMTGISKYSMDYLYTDGKLELQTPIADYAILKLGKGEQDFKYDETMIARMEMDVYNQVEEGRTVAFKIKKDDQVVFHKIRRINGRPWYQVSVGENTGWLECGEFKYHEYEEGDDEYDGSSEYFHNAAFAG